MVGGFFGLQHAIGICLFRWIFKTKEHAGIYGTLFYRFHVRCGSFLHFRICPDVWGF